jgi:hypothetical protein
MNRRSISLELVVKEREMERQRGVRPSQGSNCSSRLWHSRRWSKSYRCSGAERSQTQALNQQLQQQLSQIQSQVHSQATIQPSAQDFKYKPSTPDSFSGAATKLEGWIDQVELHMDLARIPRTDGIFRLAVAKQFLGEEVRRWARMQQDVSGWTDLKERMRVYYDVPNKDKNIRDSLNKLRQTGSVAEYTNRFNHLVLQVEEMSQADKAFHFVKGLKANVKLEVEKEWVKTPGMSITQMKQLADRTDNLLWKSRTQRPYESAIGGDVSGPTPMQLGSMSRTFDQFKIPPEKRDEVMSKRLCFKCMEPGHQARNCPKNE